MVSHTRSQKSSEITDSKQKTRPDPTDDPANRNGRLTRVVVVIEKLRMGCRRRIANQPDAALRPDRAEHDPAAIVAGKRISDVNAALDYLWSGRADRVAEVVEVVAGLFVRLRGWPNNFANWAVKRAPALSRAELEAIADDARDSPEPFCPWRVGALLRLSEVTRVRLQITHIRPCDLSPAEVEQSRRAAKRLKDERRRRAQGEKARSEAVDRRRPWEALGISRATYYRRKRNGTSSRETNSRHVYIIDNTSRETVSTATDPISLSGGGALEARPPKAASSKPEPLCIPKPAEWHALPAWQDVRPAFRQPSLEIRARLFAIAAAALSPPPTTRAA